MSPLDTLPAELREACAQVADAVTAAGGRALLVGGVVRDWLLGLPGKDVDIEVFGLPAAELRRVLRQRFQVVEVGSSFGVFKLRGLEVDIALPRRESKTGRGHKGFAVEGDPGMTVAEASARRDFTINSIYWDIARGGLLDPHGGREDLVAAVLRHTGPQFAEDPLRVLRGMQFIARFGLRADPATVAACRAMTIEDLPPERLFEEWRKLILKGRDMSAGLNFLRETGWLHYFPELEALVGCAQDPQWHPEGDVWTHTLHAMDAFATLRTGDDAEDLIIGLAVLCHDMGKPLTSFTDAEGHIRSPGHDAAGEAPARAFLERLTRQHDLIEAVLPLVQTHMQPAMLHRNNAGKGAIRRLALKVRIDRLCRLARADMRGSPPKRRDETPCDWLLEQARELAVEAGRPRPILQGRHLIQKGLRPGPEFGPLLQRAFEAQLEGAFSDEAGALAWLDQNAG